MGYGMKFMIVLICLGFALSLVQSGTMYDKYSSFAQTGDWRTLIDSFFAGKLIIALMGGLSGLLLAGILVGLATGNGTLVGSLIPYLISSVAMLSLNVFFVLPISDFSTAGSVMLPNPISTFIVIIFNALAMGMVISFVMGRDL